MTMRQAMKQVATELGYPPDAVTTALEKTAAQSATDFGAIFAAKLDRELPANMPPAIVLPMLKEIMRCSLSLSDEALTERVNAHISRFRQKNEKN